MLSCSEGAEARRRVARWITAGTPLILAALACAALTPVAFAAGGSAVAARTWTRVHTPHVEVLTDAGRAVGERVAARLEELRSALATAAPALVVEAAPVQVIVFRDEAIARAYAPTWRGVRDDVAGFFHSSPDRRRLLFVDDKGKTPSVAQHEYTHALLDAALPDAPLWLNEGLAEYFSSFHVEGDHARAGTPLATHVGWFEDHDLMSLSELFAVSQGASAYHEGDRRGTFYAQAWLLVHLLLSGEDPARLERVLVATRDGERFASAFRREFGDERLLRERLLAYAEKQRFVERDWARAGRRATAVAPRVSEGVPVSDVLATLGIGFLARPVAQREEAEDHLRAALALDANHAEACAGMGWLQLLRGKRPEARTWFTRALAGRVTVPVARLVASQLLFDVSARNAQDERKEVGLFTRGLLERSLAASPDEPELTALLARSWVVWHGDDPEPGYGLAVRAAAALPGRNDVRLDLVALAALTGREAEAVALVERHFPHGVDPEIRRAALHGLLSGDVRAANLRAQAGDFAGAESRLRAARRRVADEPELADETERYLAEFAHARVEHQGTERQNRAIAEFNAGVKAANARRFAEAGVAFTRAAELTERADFRTRATLMAKRMEMRMRGDRAVELARQGDRAGALTLLESVDRTVLDAEDRRWLDDALARLRAR